MINFKFPVFLLIFLISNPYLVNGGTILYDRTFSSDSFIQDRDFIDHSDIGINGTFKFVVEYQSNTSREVLLTFASHETKYRDDLTDQMSNAINVSSRYATLTVDTIIAPAETITVGMELLYCDGDSSLLTIVELTPLNGSTEIVTLNTKVEIIEKGVNCTGGGLTGGSLLFSFPVILLIGFVALFILRVIQVWKEV